jgi:predicted dehydrogenase
VELVGVFDVRPESAREVAAQTGCRAFASIDALADACEALSIVVPAHLHHRVALPLLRQGKHLLIEKPLASTLAEARELIEAAEMQAVVLAVGHVERFSPALAAVDALPGPIRHLQARRHCPYPPVRPGLPPRGCEVSVAHDLMIHDLDLCLLLLGGEPVHVSAYGQCAPGPHADFLAAQLTYADGCVAEISASRLATAPVRELVVAKDSGHVAIDLRTRQATVRRFVDGMVVTTPFPVAQTNPLGDELADFCRAVRSASRPRTDGNTGLQALSLVEEVITAAQCGQ